MRVINVPAPFLQSPPDPVALNGLFRGSPGHRKADPRGLIIAALACLQNEGPPGNLAAARRGEELAPDLKAFHKAVTAGLGRQSLASTNPSTVQNLPAVAGRHARTKTMAALAHKPAGLKCPFHRLPAAGDAALICWNTCCGRCTGHAVYMSGFLASRTLLPRPDNASAI